MPTTWEDEDDELYGMGDGEDDSASAVPAQAAQPKRRKSVFGQELSGALDRDVSLHQTQPRPENYKRSIWGTIAGAAVNAAAGYANAGGRVNIDTRGLEQAAQSLSRPGYSRDARNWQAADAALHNEIKNRSAQAGIERQGMADDRAEAVAESSISRNKAAEARYNRPTVPRQPAPPAPPSTYEAKLVRDLDSQDPAVREAAQKRLDELKAPRPAAGRNRTPDDVLLDPNSTPEQKREAERVIRLKRERVGGSAGPKQGDKKIFGSIEARKQSRLQSAETRAKRRLAAGEDQQQVYADLDDEKQQIQNGYEAEIEASGGDSSHMDYSPTSIPDPGAVKEPTQQPARTPAPPVTPPPNAPPRAGQQRKVASRAKVAAFAAAKGISPQEAEAALVKEGWVVQ